MKIALSLFILLISIVGNCESYSSALKYELDTRAISEKWTFEYSDENVGKFKTGLVSKTKMKGVTYDTMKDVTEELPKKYDLRDKKIGDIRNQGNCGSCWAFSLTSVVNDLYMLYLPTEYKGQLSEQYLVSCASDMYGCGGGMPSAMKWMVSPKGAPLLSDWPYTQSNGRCNMSDKKVAGTILEWHYVGEPDREPTIEEIKKAIYKYGSVSITIAADNALSSYKSGVFNACRSSNTNHMTNYVGWDDEKKAFIMRNSWGKGWGEEGYGYISYNDGKLCNAAGEMTVYAKVTNEPPKPPEPKEFGMVFDSVKYEIKIESSAKYTMEDMKKVITMRTENLEDEE